MIAREPDMKGGVVVDQYVDLSGKLVVGTMFVECLLFLRRDSGAYMHQVNFNNCDYFGDGWPFPQGHIRTVQGVPRHEPEVTQPRAQRRAQSLSVRAAQLKSRLDFLRKLGKRA